MLQSPSAAFIGSHYLRIAGAERLLLRGPVLGAVSMGEQALPSTRAEASAASSVTLRNILWLRVAASVLVVLYHAARFFDDFPKDVALEHSEFQKLFGYFGRALTQWHMPMFFMLSGYSLKLSLSKVCCC